MDSVHKCQFTAHAACFLTRHFMSHAKVITLKIILRRPFLQWAKAPQLSDSLTETRMCPQICIVSAGLLTAVGAGSCMLNCSESLNQRCLFLPGDPTLCPSALDTRWGRKQSWHAMKRDSRPVFIRDGAKEPDVGWSEQSWGFQSSAWQVSLRATTAICVCRDKPGTIEIPVINQILKRARPSSIYRPHISARSTTFYFPISRYCIWRPSKMSKIARPTDVMGGPRHTHQAESSPVTGVRQTRGYCNQLSLETHGKEIPFPKDQNSQVLTGNRRRQRTKGH